jgi:hypothetical protein
MGLKPFKRCLPTSREGPMKLAMYFLAILHGKSSGSDFARIIALARAHLERVQVVEEDYSGEER